MPRRPDSIHALAADLGINVNTLKALCRRGVFPRSMVHKTPGGHWRVYGADLPRLKIKLLLWNFWHRKGIRRPCWIPCRAPNGSYYRERRRSSGPSPTRSHDRQDELENLVFGFIQMKDRGFILNTRDYSHWTKSKNIKQVCRDEKKIKKDGWIDNLDSRALSRLILKVHVERLKQEQGKTKITVRELSKYMNLGVQTLYRTYGRDILRAALYSTVNDHYLTSKTQVGQAKEAIASKGFRLPPSNQDVDRPLWDESKA